MSAVEKIDAEIQAKEAQHKAMGQEIDDLKRQRAEAIAEEERKKWEPKSAMEAMRLGNQFLEDDKRDEYMAHVGGIRVSVLHFTQQGVVFSLTARDINTGEEISGTTINLVEKLGDFYVIIPCSLPMSYEDMEKCSSMHGMDTNKLVSSDFGQYFCMGLANVCGEKEIKTVANQVNGFQGIYQWKSKKEKARLA